MSLYYEAHITIEPVFDERRDEAATIAMVYTFKLAHLLMKKRQEDTEERSDKDTFMTAHSHNLPLLQNRMVACIEHLQSQGFKVWRYKIEDVVLDSRNQDSLNLLGVA